MSQSMDDREHDPRDEWGASTRTDTASGIDAGPDSDTGSDTGWDDSPGRGSPSSWRSTPGSGEAEPGQPTTATYGGEGRDSADGSSSSWLGGGIGVTLLAALVGAILGTAGTLALSQAAPDTIPGRSGGGEVRAPVVQQPQGDGEIQSDTNLPGVAAVAEAVTPSVVRVDRLEVEGGVPEPVGLGSGVIFRSDGYIITNNHVVEGADRLEVKFTSGEPAEARVVGTDPLTDTAVLRVDRTGLPAINVRDIAANPLQVGEPAVAIGSPFGLNATVTSGVVSALNRTLSVPASDNPQEDGIIPIPNVVQTDAAVNPGNSGGALVDAEGRLIGINTAIASSGPQISGQPPGNVGIGFAVNAEDAVSVAETLIQEGEVRHARLGIQGGDVTAAAINEFGLEVEQGAFVASVEPGGPADEAGIQQNDVIVGLDGEEITSFDDLVAKIRDFEPNDQIQVTISRGGERQQLDVTLGEFSPSFG